MADPVTILCSILTIADSSKRVLDVCTEYVHHARNAPKELHTLIEDVHALNGVMKWVDKLTKSAPQKRNQDTFDFWELHLKRLDEHTQNLVQLISKLDMKIGLLHEMKFRARWSHDWRAVNTFRGKIMAEKAELQLVTSLYGVEIVGTVFEIVDQRLPRELLAGTRSSNDDPSIHWEQVDQKYCTPDQRPAFILQRVGGFVGWKLATYEYPQFDDPHQENVIRSTGYAKEVFLDSEVYQAWKGRKTRGPGLLCATGAAATGKTTLCCQIIQDLQSSKMRDIGIAYFYLRSHFSTPFVVTQMLQFLIVQLAAQCESLPSDLLSKDTTIQGRYSLPPLEKNHASLLAWIDCMQSLLASLLTKFRRTFLVIDGLDELPSVTSRDEGIEALRVLLEQDLGNISIAIFSRPTSRLKPLLQLADVSIKLTPMEPDLGGYVRLKVNQKVKPLLIAEKLDHDEDYLAMIQEIMTEASAGLYLGADVLIDSLVTTIGRGGSIAAFLREAREDNEIMLQRDPESMKQKAFGVETRNPVAGPSKRFNQGRITP